MKDINRIKVVLVEKKRTSKWLSEQLEKDGANRERNNKLACVFCRDAAYFIQRFCNYIQMVY